MANTIEVLDALPGSGKTHSIVHYMTQHQDKPWLYISPVLEEVDVRIPEMTKDLNFDVYVPQEDKINSKSDNVLKALKLGRNICCTHQLMYKFTNEHLKYIKQNEYCVVSDEEINLIEGYNLKKGDIDFLLKYNVISIDEVSGKVDFNETKRPDELEEFAYSDLKAKADLGMLYSAKRKGFFVVQLSPKIIECSNRFILLTYNYTGSVMQTFLELHNFEFKRFEGVQLYKSNQEIKKDLLERIEFINLPSVKKIQRDYSLSKRWWIEATREQRSEVSATIRYVMRNQKVGKQDLYYTIPKDFVLKSKGFDTSRIGSDPEVDEQGGVLENTRTFIACNARATNSYADKTVAVHAYNLFCNQSVKAFLQGQGKVVNDDVFALNMFLQWLYRGCIRKKGDQKLRVAILSSRMHKIFTKWLLEQTE